MLNMVNIRSIFDLVNSVQNYLINYWRKLVALENQTPIRVWCRTLRLK